MNVVCRGTYIDWIDLSSGSLFLTSKEAWIQKDERTSEFDTSTPQEMGIGSATIVSYVDLVLWIV